MRLIKRYEFDAADVKQALLRLAKDLDPDLDLRDPSVLFLDNEEVEKIDMTVEIDVGGHALEES